MSGSKGRVICDKITSSHVSPAFYSFYLGLAERDHDFPLIGVWGPNSFNNSLPLHSPFPSILSHIQILLNMVTKL